MERVFLGWDEPPLVSAVSWLRERFARGAEWDLENVTLVLPGRRAGRRLLERLVLEAEERKLRLTPPEIVTEGRLPETLYRPKKPFADSLAQDLAWRAALEGVSPGDRAAVVPHPPEADDFAGWLTLSRMLRRLHVELAAEGLQFSTVAEKAAKLEGFAESPRWRALAAIQTRYLATLDSLNLWDIQTARIEGIRLKEFATTRRLVILGAVDLNRTLRLILGQVTDQTTILIAAPPTLASKFDPHGCVVPDAWRDERIPLTDEQWSLAGDVFDHVEAVAHRLASYDGRFRADQITIGVPDETIVPQLQRRLDQVGVASRWVQGKTIDQTGPYRLLEAMVEALDELPADAAAGLARHPDVFAWLVSERSHAPEVDSGSWTREVRGLETRPISVEFLDELDEFRTAFLPLRMAADQWPAQARREATRTARPKWRDALAAVQRLEAWLRPLSGRKPLREWSRVLLHAIRTIYAGRTFDRAARETHVVRESLASIAETLHARERLPAALDRPVTAREAVRLTLEDLTDDPIPPPSQGDAIELLGWLELPLDDAPALIATSFNEGFVPESTTADPFLPNALRKALGLIDNDRRYARDAYATSAIVASRKKSGRDVLFVTARRDVENNPLVPSRLLFAVEPKRAVALASKCFGESPLAAPRTPLVGWNVPIPKNTGLPTPPVDDVERRLETFRVTWFRDYLADPYRFYLRHVLGLGALDDSAEELDGGAFGSLCHDCLQRFGQASEIRDSDNPAAIFEWLGDALDDVAGDRFGQRRRRVAVSVQVDRVRMRLEAFARWQAKRRRDGWKIFAVEKEDANLKVEFPVVDDETVTLLGRIDRIDRHETNGWQVLDYKTGDWSDTPEKSHGPKDGQWLDLQLPLYRILAAASGVSGDPDRIGLGYVVLPRDLAKTGLELARWTPAELRSADQVAREVIESVWEGRFDHAGERPEYEDDFTAICQDRRRTAPRLVPEPFGDDE